MKTTIDERYENEEKKNRRIGLAGAFGSVGLILAILISFGLYYQVPSPPEIGVAMILGTPDGGMMMEFAELPTSEESSSNLNPDESLTQDIEDAPNLQTDPSKPNPVTSNTEENNQTKPTPTRTFNPNNRTGGGKDEGEKEGNKGNPDGGDHGNIIGSSGDGDFGIGDGGRKAIFTPVAKATCTQKGQIQVLIIVDARGKVTEASFVAAGSTTTNSVCVREAVNLAKQWEFQTAPAGTKNVKGIITIILQ